MLFKKKYGLYGINPAYHRQETKESVLLLEPNCLHSMHGLVYDLPCCENNGFKHANLNQLFYVHKRTLSVSGQLRASVS